MTRRTKRKIKLKTLELFKEIAKTMAPPPKLTVSEWADNYRVLSSESSAEAGRWSTDRAPYQREIMDAVSDANVETIVIMSSAQIGKALDIDTVLPTPDGWIKMKDVKVGDVLFDEQGERCEVTFVTDVMYNHSCFEVKFSDGNRIIADKNHLWTVDYEKYGVYYGKKTLTTGEMVLNYKTGKRNNYAIPVSRPLNLNPAELLIDPYVLGVWLGDGNSHSAQITLHEKDLQIVENIRTAGYTAVVRYNEKRNKNIVNVQIDPWVKGNICLRGHNMDEVGRTSHGYCAECHRQRTLKSKWKDDNKLDPVINNLKTFHSKLVKLGVIKNKHIPGIYLRASYEQRLALLQGLMDTDGYISNSGRCEFTSASFKLIKDLSELLHSLGIKHTLKSKDTRIKATNFEGKAWRLSFLVYNDMPVFRLKRKLQRQKSREGCRTTETERRRIISIKEVESKPVKCITVNSQSHLYLAGEAMIPTHNTELINNIIGYHMDYDPCPMMLVMPTDALAKTWSKKRLSPMLRDTPRLRDKVKDSKSRDSDNTILEKGFPGGYIAMVGANSPVGLSSRPIRILLADEVDRFPPSAGPEGDPINLAEKRTATFWNRKKIFVSTPTEAGISRIEKEYNTSSQEEWNIPCPLCGKYQPIKWEYIKFNKISDKGTDVKNIFMECKFCKEKFTEFEWKSQSILGKWVAREKGITKKRGFHLNAFASPWERWEELIKQFLEAKRKGKESLKTWINTCLGETWEDDDGESADEDILAKRRETYNCEVPDGVLVLTAGVDVQDNRLEVEVVGWGLGKENWGIEYKVFYGDPGQQAVWNQLDEYLSKEFFYMDRQSLYISCTCIDSGGHYTDEVYKFCKNKEYRRIFAVKGYGGSGRYFIGKPSKNNRGKVPLFPLGVDAGKDTIYSRLKIEEEGPGYCHFPREKEKGYNEAYFKGLCSERKVTKHEKGVISFKWMVKTGRRNEPLDLRNYATAAFEILNPNLEMLEKMKRNGNFYAQKPINAPKTVSKKRKIISKGVT